MNYYRIVHRTYNPAAPTQVVTVETVIPCDHVEITDVGVVRIFTEIDGVLTLAKALPNGSWIDLDLVEPKEQSTIIKP